MSTPTQTVRTETAPTRNRTPERVAQRAPTVTPFVDVFENAHEILLVADVPGATREGIDVHLDKGQLSLSARRTPPTPTTANGTPTTPLEPDEHVFDYHRVFAVPSGIDATKIEAELTAGVLTVKLPKSEALKPRRIEVKGG